MTKFHQTMRPAYYRYLAYLFIFLLELLVGVFVLNKNPPAPASEVSLFVALPLFVSGILVVIVEGYFHRRDQLIRGKETGKIEYPD